MIKTLLAATLLLSSSVYAVDATPPLIPDFSNSVRGEVTKGAVVGFVQQLPLPDQVKEVIPTEEFTKGLRKLSNEDSIAFAVGVTAGVTTSVAVEYTILGGGVITIVQKTRNINIAMEGIADALIRSGRFNNEDAARIAVEIHKLLHTVL